MTVKAVEKETRTVIGQVPDASWPPTFEQIEARYSVRGNVGSSTGIKYDTADANAYGPLSTGLLRRSTRSRRCEARLSRRSSRRSRRSTACSWMQSTSRLSPSHRQPRLHRQGSEGWQPLAHLAGGLLRRQEDQTEPLAPVAEERGGLGSPRRASASHDVVGSRKGIRRREGDLGPVLTVKAAGKESRTVVGQVPDAPWLPAHDQIHQAYNLRGTVVNNTNIAFDAPAADLTMRMQLAHYAGLRLDTERQLHGDEPDEALDRIDEEYRVLLSAVNTATASFIIGQRGYRVTLSSGHDGLLKTSLEPFSNDRRGRRKFARSWPNEEQTEVTRHARVLALMLVDEDWAKYSEEQIWTCWEALVVTDSAGKRWLAGSRAASNLIGELREAVVRRTRYKFCRFAGVPSGYPRQVIGQFCAAGRRVFVIKELESRWGIDLAAPGIDLKILHARPPRPQAMRRGGGGKGVRRRLHRLSRRLRLLAHARRLQARPPRRGR